MPVAPVAKPAVSVRLFKSISRSTIDGNWAVSGRYQGKDPYINLTPWFQTGSSIRTSKSVREPAGAFSLSFADAAQEAWGGGSLESIYGLVEPMDVIEIRMWGGIGEAPAELPIVMRGFVSQVQRQRAVDESGRPQRQVIISGQDYGKIWQTYRLLYMKPYQNGIDLLTQFKLWKDLGIAATNTMKASTFVKEVCEKVINRHMREFMPETGFVPRELTLGDGIAVKTGVVNNSYQTAEGSVYDLLRRYGDVGVWNELYTEDREDGVHVVYRPIPAFLLSTPEERETAKIQADAPTPGVAIIKDHQIKQMSAARSDANVANFFWVINSKFDLIDDISRKLYAIGADEGSVVLRDYPNAAIKYYGVRPMYAESQQGETSITNMGPNLPAVQHEARSAMQRSWIDRRRQIMLEMNKDNVVYERGSAVVKGGPERVDGRYDLLKAGDYVVIIEGSVRYLAYVVELSHEFQPFVGYTTTIQFERGEGFATRASMEGSPWLAEQVRRADDNLGLL